MIALDLLNIELERLVRDHYADGQSRDCDGCDRAYRVAREIATLSTPPPFFPNHRSTDAPLSNYRDVRGFERTKA